MRRNDIACDSVYMSTPQKLGSVTLYLKWSRTRLSPNLYVQYVASYAVPPQGSTVIGVYYKLLQTWHMCKHSTHSSAFSYTGQFHCIHYGIGTAPFSMCYNMKCMKISEWLGSISVTRVLETTLADHKWTDGGVRSDVSTPIQFHH